MLVIAQAPVYFDTDDTLILWNLSEYPDLPKVEVAHPASYMRDNPKPPAVVAIHQKNVNMLVRLSKAGRYIIVHSGNGHAWAAAVVRALGIEMFVDQVMDKSKDCYVDDIPAEKWIGEQVWRDPVTGEG